VRQAPIVVAKVDRLKLTPPPSRILILRTRLMERRVGSHIILAAHRVHFGLKYLKSGGA
jgi:hypothetical protein